MVPVLFVGTNNVGIALLAAVALGWFASGQYTWMAAWLPELFPTRMRATAAAFVFNAPRLIAWVGPLISGALIANLGGYSQAAITISIVYLLGLAAAPFLPETNGKPLPP
jgi:MFS family permease